jgi:hypothetical protein
MDLFKTEEFLMKLRESIAEEQTKKRGGLHFNKQGGGGGGGKGTNEKVCF